MQHTTNKQTNSKWLDTVMQSCCCCGDPNRNYQPGQKIKDNSDSQTPFIIHNVHGEKIKQNKFAI